MGKTDITPKEMKDVISGKLSRYFGVSIKEASTEQLYKSVVMAVRDILLEKGDFVENFNYEKWQRLVKAGRLDAANVLTTEEDGKKENNDSENAD